MSVEKRIICNGCGKKTVKICIQEYSDIKLDWKNVMTSDGQFFDLCPECSTLLVIKVGKKTLINGVVPFGEGKIKTPVLNAINGDKGDFTK
jgi:hypothetical protein